MEGKIRRSRRSCSGIEAIEGARGWKWNGDKGEGEREKSGMDFGDAQRQVKGTRRGKMVCVCV